MPRLRGGALQIGAGGRDSATLEVQASQGHRLAEARARQVPRLLTSTLGPRNNNNTASSSSAEAQQAAAQV